MGLYDLSFYDLVRRNGTAFSQNVCWYEVDAREEVTFSTFCGLVDQIAAGLAELGIAKGDRLGVVGKNSLEFFLVYGAAAKLGTIVLPINWRLSGDEMCFNLNDCSPKVIFVDKEFQELIREKRSDLAGDPQLFNLKGDDGDFTPFTTLKSASTISHWPEVAGDDGFVIIHTAAVAGRPRGAVLSHTNVMLANLQLNSSLDMRATSVHLNLLPLFHVAGLFLAVSTFQAGGCNVNVSKFDGAGAARLIQERKVNYFFDFPPILETILRAAKDEKIDISSLDGVIGLGTPETIDTFERMAGGDYHVMYGQTETSCLASIGRYRDKPGSAGKAIPLGDVLLVDEYDNPVEQGEVGEITLRGPMVFRGYWGLDEDNAYTFREGRHHTGDLGRFDEDGYLFYAGRKAEKELIKPGGENVYPAEVEKVILQHPAVEKTAVIGVPDPKWKEGIKAVCTLKQGERLETRELIEFVGQRIARFKKPQYVEFVGKMPVGDDGAIDRAEVKRLYGAG